MLCHRTTGVQHFHSRPESPGQKARFGNRRGWRLLPIPPPFRPHAANQSVFKHEAPPSAVQRTSLISPLTLMVSMTFCVEFFSRVRSLYSHPTMFFSYFPENGCRHSRHLPKRPYRQAYVVVGLVVFCSLTPVFAHRLTVSTQQQLLAQYKHSLRTHFDSSLLYLRDALEARV